MSQDFDIWFSTFLEEKALSELVLEFENDRQWNYFPIQVLQEYLNSSSTEFQDKIKTKLVQLDFYNQDIRNFLEYIANFIAK